MGTLFANGINQQDLLDVFAELCTDWTATITKVDADLGDVDYSAYNVTVKAEFSKGGMNQQLVIEQLQELVTSFNAILALLDADDGVNYTDYVATYEITDNINEATVPTGILDNGLNQGALISLLNTLKTNINLCLAHLDNDSSLTDVNYESTNTIGYAIDATGA